MKQDPLVNHIPLSQLESVGLQAALVASDILRDGFYSSHLGIREKTSKHDLVTEFDEKAERAIIQVIKKAFPDHAIIGEEGGFQGDLSHAITWVIDPIDGTWNFSRQIPSFATSIAAMYQGEIWLGVVLDPIANELFIAKKGHGATMNGKPIHVSNTSILAECGISLGTTVGTDHIHKIALIRRSGSAVLDLCYVAKGALDGYLEWKLCLWDFAAAKLIIEEAGGRVTSPQETPLSLSHLQKHTVIASNGLIHKDLIEWISMERK